MNHHHFSNHSTTCPDEALNVFDEQVFAHTDNGIMLAIHPRHIDLSQWRSLGSIPAVVKDWSDTEEGRLVLLSVKDRAREILFRVDLPADQLPSIALLPGMTLYMSFRWDKVIEYSFERESGYAPCTL